MPTYRFQLLVAHWIWLLIFSFVQCRYVLPTSRCVYFVGVLVTLHVLVCCSHCVRCSRLHSGTGTQDRRVDQPSCRWQLHHLSPVALRTDTISGTAQRVT